MGGYLGSIFDIIFGTLFGFILGIILAALSGVIFGTFFGYPKGGFINQGRGLRGRFSDFGLHFYDFMKFAFFLAGSAWKRIGKRVK